MEVCDHVNSFHYMANLSSRLFSARDNINFNLNNSALFSFICFFSESLKKSKKFGKQKNNI